MRLSSFFTFFNKIKNAFAKKRLVFARKERRARRRGADILLSLDGGKQAGFDAAVFEIPIRLRFFVGKIGFVAVSLDQ